MIDAGWLRREIAVKSEKLSAKRAELTVLHRELTAFARQYTNALGSLENRREALLDQIATLQRASNPSAQFWGGYESFEASFDAKYRQPLSKGPTGLPTHEPSTFRAPQSDESVRSLYRRLVRKYHPDTARTPADTERLTVIMAQINAAWRDRDADALRAIDRGSSGQKTPLPDMSVMQKLPPSVYELARQLAAIETELTDVEIELNALSRSPLLRLKLEHTLARARGVNLFTELAGNLRVEITGLQAELKRLEN